VKHGCTRARHGAGISAADDQTIGISLNETGHSPDVEDIVDVLPLRGEAVATH